MREIELVNSVQPGAGQRAVSSADSTILSASAADVVVDAPASNARSLTSSSSVITSTYSAHMDRTISTRPFSDMAVMSCTVHCTLILLTHIGTRCCHISGPSHSLSPSTRHYGRSCAVQTHPPHLTAHPRLSVRLSPATLDLPLDLSFDAEPVSALPLHVIIISFTHNAHRLGLLLVRGTTALVITNQ